MSRLRCSVALSLFGRSLKPALKRASVSGASGVTVDTRHGVTPSEFSASAIRHLRKFLDELGLELAVATFPTRRGLADRRDLEARVEAIKGALAFARTLGVNRVTLHTGPVPRDEEDEAGHNGRELLLEVLCDLARHGNQVGSLPVLELGATGPETVRDLFGQVDTGPLGLDLCPATWTGRGHDPVSVFRELYDVVNHVRVGDAIRHSDGSYDRVPVGHGEVAWDEMLAVLSEAEYSGWLTAGTSGGDDPARDATRAISLLTSYWPGGADSLA